MSTIMYITAVFDAWSDAVEIYLASPMGRSLTASYDSVQMDCLRTVLCASIVPPPGSAVSMREDLMRYSEALMATRVFRRQINPMWIGVAEGCLADIARIRDSAIMAAESSPDTEPLPEPPPRRPDPRIFVEVDITVD